MVRRLGTLIAAVLLTACSVGNPDAPNGAVGPASSSAPGSSPASVPGTTAASAPGTTAGWTPGSSRPPPPVRDPTTWEIDGPSICAPEGGAYPLGELDPAVWFGTPGPAPDLAPGVVRLSGPELPRMGDQSMTVDGDLVIGGAWRDDRSDSSIGRYERTTGTFTRLVTFPGCSVAHVVSDGTTAWALASTRDGDTTGSVFTILAVDLATARLLWERRVNAGDSGDRNDSQLRRDGTLLRVDLELPSTYKPNARFLLGFDAATGATVSAAPIAAADREPVPADTGTWELVVDAAEEGTAELQELDPSTGAVLRTRPVSFSQNVTNPTHRIVDGTAWTLAPAFDPPGPTVLLGYPIDAPAADPARIELAAPTFELGVGPAGVFAIGTEDGGPGRSVTVIQQVDLARRVVRATTRVSRLTSPSRGGNAVGGLLGVSTTGLWYGFNAVGGEPEGPQLAEIPAVR